MMSRENSFLGQVATFLDKKYGGELADTTLVVPSYQVGHQLVGDLGRRQKTVSWAPKVYTLKAFMGQFSSLHEPDHLVLLKSLYEVGHKIGAIEEGFDAFISWGGRLLDDFDTIDHRLIPVDKLFKIPASSSDISLLSARSKAFWKAAEGQDKGLQKRWLALWTFLPEWYRAYRISLLDREMAYEGMQRRELLTSLEEGRLEVSHRHVVGVGLHKLTHAEERILGCLEEKIHLDFCWDHDPYYVEKGTSHPAGYYFRQRSSQALFKQALPMDFCSDMQHRQAPDVEVIQGKGVHGQLEGVRAAIERLVEAKGVEEVAGNTVVVVPDPSLLLPLVHALPTVLGDLKVRIGYPLTSTPAYALLMAASNIVL